ncbi:MAG: carbamoyl-phosphate synthase (glutamine-hydrolyzing) large subunit [Elusimicrobia bacterium]|nr:carbamoyl-phosphate synthase (glutamine-hydrolyzing) large subunit [Elusimicrobiota bacterium]
MPEENSNSKPKRVLVLGSGALKIGQAGEFDYSGSQALKALREEGVYTVLINPNIATVQTSEKMADAIYFLPVDPHFAEKVMVKENIDALLLSFGGQTALNCGLDLARAGILERLGVRVLGTPVEAILATEDRRIFVDRLAAIGVSTAASRACSGVDEALEAANSIGYPVILRAGYSLGGQGSAIVYEENQCRQALERAFIGSPQVLVEECLYGWKEIEYEVVRDSRDNCITVCNMENVDPMGIHTGESIVVAPSQTLNDEEYQSLRDIAIKVIRELGIIGECNIQYALDPKSSQCRVIEVNARLSRSSALASKATGYPLAYMAAKLALGYSLDELPNPITRTTKAFFEPALDYIVCKIPRWDLQKFDGANTRIGTEMKSVGEVMAVGRSFPEALQKALRMLEIGVDGLDPYIFNFDNLRFELKHPSPLRIFAVAKAFAEGASFEEIASLTQIDRFFLAEIERIVALDKQLSTVSEDQLDRAFLLEIKKQGFSDKTIASRTKTSAQGIRSLRRRLGVRPYLAQIDTLAAEYPAQTNYLYLTYAASASDADSSSRRKILVLGSGCYRIGSSVEFDWCCVNAAWAAQESGYETILLNCNPETVSTDYDVCDRLIFDEITLETVLEIVDVEKPEGVLVSMGGQTANNLALKLHRHGVRILGTPPESIDQAEDREKFSALLDSMGMEQPKWLSATRLDDLDKAVETLGGYPVLVRPSYVLSGAAMRVAHNEAQLRHYLTKAANVSPEHPVVISQFERHSREIEIDAVADRGRLILWAISEHIEDAGVHSGDATLVLPPQKLYVETVRQVKRLAQQIAGKLNITGPFNVQLLARHNVVKVIECNLRASRSFPFVSKVMGVNFIREATRAMLGVPAKEHILKNPLELDYVAVKAPQFSFRRLTGADPILGVEMASTGEVACFGQTRDEALLKSLLATGFRYPKRGVLLSLGKMEEKYRFADEAKMLAKYGLPIYATPGTAEMLVEEGIECVIVDKGDGKSSYLSALDCLKNGTIDLVINVTREYDDQGRPDGFFIRRWAIDYDVPLITDLWLARCLTQAICRVSSNDLEIDEWSAYLEPKMLTLT